MRLRRPSKRAVVAYLASSSDTDGEDDDWIDWNESLRETCGEADAYFAWASGGDPTITIGPTDEPVAQLDTRTALAGRYQGWLLVGSDVAEPVFLDSDIVTMLEVSAFCESGALP